MLDQVHATQYSCYLQNLPWETLLELAMLWAGQEAQELQADRPTMDVIGVEGRFRVEEYYLRPQDYPWRYWVTFTRTQPAGPLHEWEQLHFTQQMAKQSGATCFCDPPVELRQQFGAAYWQLRINPDGFYEMVKLVEHGLEGFTIIGQQPVDVLGHPFFQASGI